MTHQFRRSYVCKKCGGSDHYVEGGKHRRCRSCRTIWRKNYAVEYYNTHYRNKKEKINKARRERYEKQRKRFLGMQAAYGEKYLERCKRHRDKRNEKIKAGNVTRVELETIRDRDNGRCIYCGELVETNCAPFRVRGFDHLVSLLDDEGEHAVWNLAVCCIECNAEKGTDSFKDYVQRKKIKADFSKISDKAWKG